MNPEGAPDGDAAPTNPRATRAPEPYARLPVVSRATRKGRVRPEAFGARGSRASETRMRDRPRRFFIGESSCRSTRAALAQTPAFLRSYLPAADATERAIRAGGEPVTTLANCVGLPRRIRDAGQPVVVLARWSSRRAELGAGGRCPSTDSICHARLTRTRQVGGTSLGPRKRRDRPSPMPWPTATDPPA